MSEMIEYKCPACGGAMEFDSSSQKMKCPYCDTEMSIADYQKVQGGANGSDQDNSSTNWTANGSGQWENGETEGMRIYSCQSCGGEIITDETTGASACPFCGNPVVMKGQFSGDLKPDYVIPFKLDKKAAKEAYYKHLDGKSFLPKVFKAENHIDEIKGIYVPFWVFGAEVHGDISYHAEKIRVWQERSVEYTEHNCFEIYRSGSISFRNVPVNCSKKMDDALMESIEPYRFSEAVPFQTAYLAGYAADRYDMKAEECIRRADIRIRSSAINTFRETVHDYQNVSEFHTNIQTHNARYWYALYPVWLLNTSWAGKNYIFAMNGQTGKMVGDLPLDKKQFRKFAAGCGLGISALLCIIQIIMTLL